MLLGPTPDREEAVERLYDNLMAYANAGPRTCPHCRAPAAAADPRSCSSRGDLPEAHVLRATSARNGTALPVLV